jgi:GNAT superfamily N-acetyltransferase
MTDTSAGTVVVRERTSDDLPGAAAALVAVHASDGYPVEGVDDPEAWLTGSTLVQAWVGELDGRVVGHVGISLPQADDAAAAMLANMSEGADERAAVLGRLFVLDAARGQSLGRKLVQAATAYARRNGLRLVLDVMTKDAAAIRLYERLGWQRMGTTEHDDGKGRLVPAVCFASPPAAASD